MSRRGAPFILRFRRSIETCGSSSSSFTPRRPPCRTFLPEPLRAAEDGLCVASGLEVPDCENYGSFEESFIVMKCHFMDQTGFYCSHVFHNGPAGIAAGREIYGTPKVYADMKVTHTDRSMVTETSYGGAPVLRIASSVEAGAPRDGGAGQDDDASPHASPHDASLAAPLDAMPALTPAWRLKIIPRADGPGPALKQLIDCTETTRDVEVHAFAQGKGTVELGASPRCDLTPLDAARIRRRLPHGEQLYRRICAGCLRLSERWAVTDCARNYY